MRPAGLVLPQRVRGAVAGVLTACVGVVGGASCVASGGGSRWSDQVPGLLPPAGAHLAVDALSGLFLVAAVAFFAQLQASIRSSGVSAGMLCAVQPLRATASNGVSSLAPGSWERWVIRRARSRWSKGLFSSHLMEPTKVIFLATGARSAPTRSISGSLVRVQ